MKKEIPALTKSGGLLSNHGGAKSVIEYRLWVHYHDGGDDKYFESNDLNALLEKIKKLLEDKKIAIVEQPVAVVWDDKHQDHREVCIDGINYDVRIMETWIY